MKTLATILVLCIPAGGCWYPELTPEPPTDARRDAMPDGMPDGMPDALPDAMPDAIPDAMPDGTPDAPDAASETLLGYPEPFAETTPLLGNFIFAIPVTVPRDVDLLAFGIITPTGQGTLAKIGLYGSDTQGAPASLVAQSNVQVLANGDNRFELPAVDVLAGDYWMAVLMDAETAIGLGDEPTEYYYDSRQFTQGLPATFPATADSDPGRAINLYLVVR